MENSKKQLETKKKLADAFMELYEKQDINHIPIKAITDRAHLNRATFYIYYDDVYDLREQIESGFLEKIVANFSRLDFMNLENFFAEMLALHRKSGNYLPVLLGKRDSAFPNRVKDAIGKLIYHIDEDQPPTPRIEYVMEYQCAGVIAIFSRMLRNDIDLPLAEIGALIKDISARGVAAVVRNERKEQ